MKNGSTFHGHSISKFTYLLLICLNLILGAQWTTAQAQQRIQVSGTVSDPSGEPVIGASVVQKGTTNGTITDLDGKFSLSVASGSTLQVSYIGYVSQEVKAISGKPLTITLNEDTSVPLKMGRY